MLSAIFRRGAVSAAGVAPRRQLITINRRNINRFLVSSRNTSHVCSKPRLLPVLEPASNLSSSTITTTTRAHLSRRLNGRFTVGESLSPVRSWITSGRRARPAASFHTLRTARTVFREQQEPVLVLLQGRLGLQLQQTSRFHTSRPNQLPLPILPVAIFTLKTPVTALVLRMISRVSLTLLPLSVKQSPKVVLTLVLIPPICFGLVIFAGLEAAPNTGRWRFLFTNEEEELEMLQEEIPTFMESIKIIEDENDPRVELVRHILKNLLSTSIEQDGSTLRTGIVEKLEKRHEEAQRRLREKQLRVAAVAAVENGAAATEESTGQAGGVAPAATKAIVSKQRPVPSSAPATVPEEEQEEEDPELGAISFDERPFQIFVAEDDTINAFSLGPPRLIYINSGLIDWLENDEDLLAAVVAHELAHVIQRHTMETHGRETVMLFLADLLRSALWTVSVPLGPWFNSWVDQTTNNLLHFTASGPLHQTIEVEADTVSLTLLALAGYDPMHAVRLWEQWAEKDQLEMAAEDSVDVHKWTDWMYDHPPSAERARYLKEAVMPAREMWEKVLSRRKEPVSRFVPLEKRLKAKVDEDGDLKEGTVEDIMETMDELLKRQEDEEAEARKQSGIRGTLRRWSTWRPWASTEIEVKAEPAQA